jgi:hypothetical protein
MHKFHSIAARAGSPAERGPPASTTPRTPHLKCGAIPSGRVTRLLRPARNRSISRQGVRKPVSVTAAVEPKRTSVPKGNRSRSRPAVVAFSPNSLGETS